MNRNTSKIIPNIITCDCKKDCQILIIFGRNIFDKTCYQITILFLISPSVCFCTTWENPNMQNRIKIRYFVGFVSLDSAKADNGCGEKLDSHFIASCVRNIDIKNYKNLIILLQVTIKNVQDVFFLDTMYRVKSYCLLIT